MLAAINAFLALIIFFNTGARFVTSGKRRFYLSHTLLILLTAGNILPTKEEETH